MGVLIEPDPSPADLGEPDAEVAAGLLDEQPSTEHQDLRAPAFGRRQFWAATVLIAVFAMPLMAFTIPASIELSFQSAQHLAVANGVDFGAEAVFTYGPLGFLVFPAAL